MGTKAKRSSGSQFNPKGVTQGNTLVDPNTGLPIDVITDVDGTRRLAVDANITAQVPAIEVELDYESDSVQIGDPNTDATLKINPDGSIDSNVEVDAADGDNIAISDGTNTMLVNPDGSINANVSINPLTTPVIVNPIATLANTEYSYAFPSNTKRIVIRARGNAKLQLAFAAGQSGTLYYTVAPGSSYEEIGLNVASLTVYFTSNKAGEVIEILSWN